MVLDSGLLFWGSSYMYICDCVYRMQEELAILRKKLDRAKKIEMASSADEVLMEEIREYKEQLTCPSCKVKKKDAVLTKCFHVFCLECLKTRYETRQRKCPKCNATFGANDYHRIYLEWLTARSGCRCALARTDDVRWMSLVLCKFWLRLP